MVDEATVMTYLERLGWQATPHGAGTLRAIHDTPEGPMTVYVRVDANWVVASVVPFLATGGDNSFELARWLLRMNRDMRMSKFAYDEDGDVVLVAELPTESLDYEELAGALTALVDDATGHRATLRAAAAS